MPSATKITLSDKELTLVTNADWILTKLAITQKIFHLFNECIPMINELINFNAETSPPKISKGENYRGLPYVTLDYPRYFKADDIYALRTMFWWGNFISITFHVAGKFKAEFDEKISLNIHTLPADMFICVNNDQWQHHFEEDNYSAIRSLSTEDISSILTSKDFIKLALRLPVHEINHAGEWLKNSYAIFGKVIG